MPLTLGVLEIRARGVERAQHSIAKVHRVAKVLEANRVLVEPRDRKPRDDGAERDDEVLVPHRELARVGPDRDDAFVLVEGNRSAEHQVGLRAQHAQGTATWRG